MSTKYFCDQCKTEMQKEEFVRVKGSYKKLSYEIIAGSNNKDRTTWNDGHFCHSCIRKAVANGGKK